MNTKDMDHVVDVVIEEYIKAKTESSEWKKLIGRTVKYERVLQKALSSYFAKQEQSFLKAFEKYKKDVSFPFLEKDFINSQKDDLFKIIYPLIKKVVNNEGQVGMAALQAKVTKLLGDFNLDDDVIFNIQSMIRTAVSEVTETTFKRLLLQYDTGLQLGESILEIRSRMSKVFQDAVKTRVNMIARTEVMRASNESRIMAYEQSGVVQKVRWYTAIDERRCSACAALHNKAVKLGKEFTKDIKAPPLHPACRCTILPEVDPQYLKSYMELYQNIIQKMGTANSGNHGHAGRPGKRGGSSSTRGRDSRTGRKPSQARLQAAREVGFSFNKLDESSYGKLSAADKVKALKKQLKGYKEQYTIKSKQNRTLSKLSDKGKKAWQDMNKRIGAYEGMRRAMISRGDNTSRVEQRKYYHFAIKLGENAVDMKKQMRRLK